MFEKIIEISGIFLTAKVCWDKMKKHHTLGGECSEGIDNLLDCQKQCGELKECVALDWK